MKVLAGVIVAGLFVALAGVGAAWLLSAMPAEPPAKHEQVADGPYPGWVNDAPHLASLPWIRSVDRPAAAVVPRGDVPWVRQVGSGPAVTVALAQCPWMRSVERPAAAVVPAAAVPWKAKAATRP